MDRMNKTRTLVQIAVLTAIVLLMAFSPIGYIRTGGVEIALIVIPVAIGAVAISPGAGAWLGLVFGLTSFFQCFGISPFGTALFGIDPYLTAFICLVPRVLMGWLAGLLYKLCKKYDKHKVWSVVVGNVAAPLINTVLFMIGLIGLFGRTEYISSMIAGQNIFKFIVAFVGLNGLLEIISCAVVGTIICKAITKVSNN